MTILVRDGGVWGDEGVPTLYLDDEAKTVQEAYVKAEGTWKKVYQKVPAQVAALTKTSDSNRHVSFRWEPVPTAVEYVVGRQIAGGGYSELVTPNTAFYDDDSFIGLAENTTYVYTVKAVNAYGNAGPWSQAYSFFTGNKDIYDVGEKSITVNPVTTGTWRSDLGWGTVGQEVRQAFPTLDFGNGGYRGVIDYGNLGVQNVLLAAIGSGSDPLLGSDRLTNGFCSEAKVYLTRKSGVGNTTAAVTVSFYTSDSAGSGGTPVLEGSQFNTTSTLQGAAKWYNISTEHGARLANGDSRSVAIYRNSKIDYVSFLGKNSGGENCKLVLKWKWDYIRFPAQPRQWGLVPGQ